MDSILQENGDKILQEDGGRIVNPRKIAYSSYMVLNNGTTKTIKVMLHEGAVTTEDEHLISNVTRFRSTSKLEDHDFVFSSSATQQEIDDTVNAWLDTKATELITDITTQRYA